MAKYTGGTMVKGGYYWNARSWGVEVVTKDGGRLPEGDAKYLKVPLPLLFVIVPVLGALFLMFLPLIGFALFGVAIVRKVAGGVKASATELATTLSPGWIPGEAHLTGKPGDEKTGAGEVTPELEKLGEEIAAKRGEKK